MIGASAAIIKNSEDKILIVKPTYRDEWLLPGGAIEKDESPIEACERECLEELGLKIEIGQLLCLEYYRSSKDKPETMRFVFDGGAISDASSIELPPDELENYTFTSIKVAVDFVDAETARRLQLIAAGKGVYFER